MRKIGLTGGIGSGKSYVADLCQQWGASVVDTDVIAHELTQPHGAAIELIRQQFGAAYINDVGAMCRESMRELVFNDPIQRERLQDILHPLIREIALEQVANASGCYVLVVVPLLIESGQWLSTLDAVCVVDCDEATQIARVVQRNRLTPEQIRRIIGTQATREQRLAAADYVIKNGADISLAQLSQQTRRLHQHWLTAAPSSEDN